MFAQRGKNMSKRLMTKIVKYIVELLKILKRFKIEQFEILTMRMSMDELKI